MNEEEGFGFAKKERVTGDKRVDALFSQGRSFISYPFRVVYLKVEQEAVAWPLSILVSVPKRRIRSAVRRNRMKRQVRESYRLNKSLFFGNELKRETVGHYDVAFVCVADKLCNYQVVEKGMKKALEELNRRIGQGVGH